MIVLDTHIWFRWLDAQKSQPLPKHIEEMIMEADRVAISSISCLEIATLAKRGRIVLTMPVDTWLNYALKPSGVDMLTVDCRISYLATQLPDIHKDPADRLIIATALEHKATLISFDRFFDQYGLGDQLINK